MERHEWEENQMDEFVQSASIRERLVTAARQGLGVGNQRGQGGHSRYCPLMAASITRSQKMTPGLTSILIDMNSLVCEYVKDPATDDEREHFRKLGQLLTVNAALSRFSSQTFAGTPPISGTECHFWLHSFLGVGLASLALQNVVDFLTSKLGPARIGVRFEALKDIPADFDLQMRSPPGRDYLSLASNIPEDPLVPVLGYFSARDGYRSTEWAVSAPLAAISACNSTRWSLLTITHELTHIVIRSVLTELCPDLSSQVELENCVALFRSRDNRKSVLDQIRFVFLLSLVELEKIEHHRDIHDITPSLVKTLISEWRTDVDEIMVHAFDFLYFYGRDVKKYVAGIWNSWSSIPNLNRRIPDYVVRTVCAVLTNHLERADKGEETARDSVLQALNELEKTRSRNEYVVEAAVYLKQNWDEVVLPRVRARRQIIKIVASFLFSPQLATSMRTDTGVASGSSQKGGYNYVRGDLNSDAVVNPITFLEEFTSQPTPSSEDSAWMLYKLAFGSRGS